MSVQFERVFEASPYSVEVHKENRAHVEETIIGGLALSDLRPMPAEVKSRFEHVREFMKQDLIGQDDAIEPFINMMDRASVRLDKKPLASMLFIGPSGTGKTETSEVFDSALRALGKRVVYKKINCGDYAERHEIATLLGAPPGYKGYDDPAFFDPKFFAASKQDNNQISILLLDELEKGHDQLHKMFLAMLDKGELQLRDNRTVYFHNTVIIATSNAGAEDMSARLKPALGFSSGSESKQANRDSIKSAALKGLEQEFKHMPEFLNRFTDTVVFMPHTEETFHGILEKTVRNRNRQYKLDQGVEVELSDKTKKLFVDAALKEVNRGARPLIDLYSDKVEVMMGRYISANQLTIGSKLVVAHESELPVGFAESDSSGLVFLTSYSQEIFDEYHQERARVEELRKQKELESMVSVVSEETIES